MSSFNEAVFLITDKTNKEIEQLMEKITVLRATLSCFNIAEEEQGTWRVTFDDSYADDRVPKYDSMIMVGSVASLDKVWAKVAKGRRVISIKPL